MNNSGRIVKAVAGVFDVFSNGSTVSAFAAGRFRSEKITPLVGDTVTLLPPEHEGDKPLIDAIGPRKNCLLRPPVANVDRLVIVLAAKEPAPDLLLADELICCCRLQDITPLIVVNKQDDGEDAAAAIARQYATCGIDAMVTSARTGAGVPELLAALPEGISCFCGQSAVGKSSLMNALLKTDRFRTGELSRKIRRGKNTTRLTELVQAAPEKWIADTPGFSLLELPLLSPEQFLDLYPEYAEYAHTCRFTGCSHINEPDCAVKQAIAEGRLGKERYERFCQLYAAAAEKWRRRYD